MARFLDTSKTERPGGTPGRDSVAAALGEGVREPREGVKRKTRGENLPTPTLSGMESGDSGRVGTSWCRPRTSKMSRLVTDQWKVRPGTALPKEKGFWLLVIPVT